MALETGEERKSGWLKPENWVAAAPFIALGIVGVYFLDPIMAKVQDLLQNTFQAALYLGGLGILGFLATSADLHKLLGLWYMAAMKRATNVVYAVYPLEIMEGYLDDLRQKQKDFRTSVGALKGQLQKITEALRKKKEEYEKTMQLAEAAHNRGAQPGMALQLQFQTRKAGRLEKSGMTYQGLINQLKRLIAIMSKILEATEFMILDVADTIENEKEQRQVVDEATKSMKAAQAILFTSKKREEFDKALEASERDVFYKKGLLEQFEEDAQNIMVSIDLDNEIVNDDAVKKLDLWEKRLSEGVFDGGTGKTRYRVDPTMPAFRIDEDPNTAAYHEQAETEAQEADGTPKRQSYPDLYGGKS